MILRDVNIILVILRKFWDSKGSMGFKGFKGILRGLNGVFGILGGLVRYFRMSHKK